MRWLISVPISIGVLGVGLLIYSANLPVYTDPRAPEHLSRELASQPRETRFTNWSVRLRAYETPRKGLSDWGRGLVALAIGVTMAGAFLVFYHRYERTRSAWVIFLLWIGLWLVRTPFSAWYYNLRQERFDYPTWGDSIAIGIFQEACVWIIGAILSSALLGLLTRHYPFPSRVRFVRPDSMFGWLRAVVIALWLVILILCAGAGVSDGNEGMTISCLVAASILVIFLSASKVHTGGR